MSGGHFDYKNDQACEELFDYEVSPDYGMGDHAYMSRVFEVRKKNPVEHALVSELVYDVFCLLHSLDWYKSGDNSRDKYEQDLRFFIKKWITGADALTKSNIDATVMILKANLYQTFGLEVPDDNP